MSRPLRSKEGHLGELCVIRENGVPFSEADGSLLATLADMAAIAVTTARLKEAEEQLAIVAERDRIARELHDSLAQVLGHIHFGSAGWKRGSTVQRHHRGQRRTSPTSRTGLPRRPGGDPRSA
jgi:signal transduction histidine kinase